MSNTVTPLNSKPLIQKVRPARPIEPISIETAKLYRPSAIRQMDLILKQRTQTLQQTRDRLCNAKTLLAILLVYSIIITLIAFAAIGAAL